MKKSFFVISVLCMSIAIAYYMAKPKMVQGNLFLLNVEALASYEEDEYIECYTLESIETTSVRQGNSVVKVSECRTCDCNYGNKGDCEEGSECVYYNGPYAGQTSGTIVMLYCY